MKWPRVSVAGLMAGILAIAVGLAALKNPTALVASVMGTLLEGSLLFAVLGVVLRRGGRQAFWIGFLVFGGGYALLAFDLSPPLLPKYGFSMAGSPLQPFMSRERPYLVTVHMLRSLENHMIGAYIQPIIFDVRETFVQTGHSLLGLVIGVVGGFLGRALDDRGP